MTLRLPTKTQEGNSLRVTSGHAKLCTLWYTPTLELVTLQQEEPQCGTGEHDQGSMDEQGPSKKARTGISDV